MQNLLTIDYIVGYSHGGVVAAMTARKMNEEEGQPAFKAVALMAPAAVLQPRCHHRFFAVTAVTFPYAMSVNRKFLKDILQACFYHCAVTICAVVSLYVSHCRHTRLSRSVGFAILQLELFSRQPYGWCLRAHFV